MEERSKGDPVQEKLLQEKQDFRKKAKSPPAEEDPNDPATKLISYCPALGAYFNFQETIAHAKNFPQHKLISVAETKVMLKKKLEEAIDNLKKREVKVEQATLEQKNEVREKMEGLRARGLQQIGVMKERVI